MITSLNKYKDDLAKLTKKGNDLLYALAYSCSPDEYAESLGDKLDDFVKGLPDFKEEYQPWYSESKTLIKQLLPDRLDDFVGHYEKPKSRKTFTFDSYRIEDCLLGYNVVRGWEKEKVAGPVSAVPHLRQQIAILKSVESRFESSLYDIRQLVQADLFDSELDAASELLKKGFLRASGAVAGVVLEKHLSQVAENHEVKTRKKNPTISDYNDLLKKNDVLDTPAWRQIQRLGDIRNYCDHKKDREPTSEEVEELISGVEKFMKSLF